MDQDSNQMEQGPVQCRNGCGFYAGSGTDGLCSVCYKDMIKKKQQPPQGMPHSLAPSEPRMTPPSMHAATMAPTMAGSMAGSPPAQATMASLSIDETSSTTATSPSVKSSATSVETASPTVIVPSSIQTDKRTESECSEGGGAAASTPADVEGPSTSNDPETPDGNKDGKKKKNRCLSCKKKVGLTGFTCRCGGLFCSIHRYSDKHECNFDYKELGAQEIRKANPVVMADKVKKI